MAKIIKLTAKNGMTKEVPFGTKIKLDPQFVGAKIEAIDAATGARYPAVKSRVEGDDIVLSLLEDGQFHEARLEGVANEASNAGTASASYASPLVNAGNGPEDQANVWVKYDIYWWFEC